MIGISKNLYDAIVAYNKANAERVEANKELALINVQIMELNKRKEEISKEARFFNVHKEYEVLMKAISDERLINGTH